MDFTWFEQKKYFFVVFFKTIFVVSTSISFKVTVNDCEFGSNFIGAARWDVDYHTTSFVIPLQFILFTSTYTWTTSV